MGEEAAKRARTVSVKAALVKAGHPYDEDPRVFAWLTARQVDPDAVQVTARRNYRQDAFGAANTAAKLILAAGETLETQWQVIAVETVGIGSYADCPVTIYAVTHGVEWAPSDSYRKPQKLLHIDERRAMLRKSVDEAAMKFLPDKIKGLENKAALLAAEASVLASTAESLSKILQAATTRELPTSEVSK